MLARFRPDRGGDVAAYLRERAAVRGGERVEAVALHRLAGQRAARARRTRRPSCAPSTRASISAPRR